MLTIHRRKIRESAAETEAISITATLYEKQINFLLKWHLNEQMSKKTILTSNGAGTSAAGGDSSFQL